MNIWSDLMLLIDRGEFFDQIVLVNGKLKGPLSLVD